jgi:hypothetical protein
VAMTADRVSSVRLLAHKPVLAVRSSVDRRAVMAPMVPRCLGVLRANK